MQKNTLIFNEINKKRRAKIKNLYNKKLGEFGENFAIKFLEKNNYKIITRNFKNKNGEIDIIAKEKNEIVFIEVKTRTSIMFGVPAESVNKQKEKHILNTSKYFLYKNGLEKNFVRYDVIEIIICKKQIVKMNHIKNIFF